MFKCARNFYLYVLQKFFLTIQNIYFHIFYMDYMSNRSIKSDMEMFSEVFTFWRPFCWEAKMIRNKWNAETFEFMCNVSRIYWMLFFNYQVKQYIFIFWDALVHPLEKSLSSQLIVWWNVSEMTAAQCQGQRNIKQASVKCLTI